MQKIERKKGLFGEESNVREMTLNVVIYNDNATSSSESENGTAGLLF